MKDEGCVCIGIDLGTYNSAAAYEMPDGKVVLLKAYHGQTWQGCVIPSFVKFYANGEVEKYGEKAREELEIAPHLVVWGLKRIIGRPYQSAIEEMHRFKYPIEEAKDGSIVIPIGSKKYTPTEIVKIFLERVKKDCESSDFNPIKGKITKAIITHPAYFDTNQIKAVKDAAQEAGFDEIELMTEPEAAALAYKDVIDFKSEPWVMVIDWGAGTLDIVICRFSLSEEGIPRIDSIFPAYGDTRLGGTDMDDALFEEAKRLYRLEDLSPEEAGKIRSEIEKGKIYLSTNPWIQKYATYKGRLISLKMARSEEEVPGGDKEGWIVLESVLNEILEKFKTHIKFALEKEGLTPDDIDQLIIVGGPAYMPCVRKAIAEIFQGNEKVMKQLERIEKEGFPVSPIEAVVRGATIYGSGSPVRHLFSVDDGEMEKSLNAGDIPQKLENAFKDNGLPLSENATVTKEDNKWVVIDDDRKFIVKKENGILNIYSQIETGEKRTPYGYGYLLDDDTGEILIPVGSSGGISKRTETITKIGLKPGESIPVSLLKSEDTPDGKKYSRIGNYKIAPVVGDRGADFIITVEMDKDLGAGLTIEDLNSPNPPFTLKLLRHQDTPIPEPRPPRRIEETPPEIMQAIMQAIMNERDKYKGKPIPADSVEEVRQVAEARLQFIESELGRGKSLHEKTRDIYDKLKQDLEKLPQGTIPPDKQFLYQAVFQGCQLLKNSLIVNDGYLEEELEI